MHFPALSTGTEFHQSQRAHEEAEVTEAPDRIAVQTRMPASKTRRNSTPGFSGRWHADCSGLF